MSPPSRVVASLLVLLAGASVGSRAEEGTRKSGAPTLADCDAGVRRTPVAPDAYDCYLAAARGGAGHAEAVDRLESRLRGVDPSPAALLGLARLEQDRGRARAEGLYRSAIEKASRTGDARSEVLARTRLARLLFDGGRRDEGRAEGERALALAETKRDPLLQAWAWVQAANAANGSGENGKARELLARVEAVAFPQGPPELQSLVLSQLGFLSWAQGDFKEALTFYGRELELLRYSGDLFAEAGVRYNIALMYATGRLASAEEIRRLEREALDTALRGRNRNVAADVHLSMGEGEPRGSRAAIRHFRQGLALATNSGTRLFAMRCLGRAMFSRGASHRAEARFWIDSALREARLLGDRHAYARACVLRAEQAFESHAPLEDVVQAYVRTFEAVEAIRDLQPEGLLRSRIFGQWVHPYYRLAGYLLRDLPQSTDPERDVELAFRASERMRARSLLDRFDAAGASPASGRGAQPLHEERGRVLDEIARLQRELMGLELPRERRRQALEELERLEREESALRGRLAESDPRFAALRTPAIPTPKQVQRALRDDEGFLSYQIWYDATSRTHVESAGSWLYAITRGSVRVFSVPPRDALEEKVAVFNGLFENRDGSEARPAAALYQDLLAAALRELPAAITRLVIVPDGALYRLPFATLRPDPNAPPLATRYEISYAPSATLWLRWRKTIGTLPAPGALALADPALQGTAETAAERAADPWLGGLHGGRLPFARREAQALVQGLGGGSVRSGVEASESALKHTSLESFGSIVFAAHAVVDDDKPERSAVLLAPGDAHEDGLLQFREIAELELKGHLVILSACRSAVGAELPGEGLMGLAHAFFQAGARAVIASLWMLRDDEQAELARRLADELASGSSLSAALATAQRSLIRDGAPATAWAGLVVLGDGARVPRPAGRHTVREAWPLTLGLPAGVALLLSGWLIRRGALRGRGRSRGPA